jgi:hypothetical protein
MEQMPRPQEHSRDDECLRAVPAELDYIVEQAVKYRLDGDDDIFAALDQLTDSDMETLAKVADRMAWSKHYAVILEITDRYPISEYDGAAWLYFFCGLLDYADLKFE